MNAFVKKKQGSDNALEDYFLDLVVQKKVIDREVHELLDIVEVSQLHKTYKTQLKKILFGNENLYLENWGTLQDGLLDAIKTGDVRADDLADHGIVINMILQIIEDVFDIPDENMYGFISLEQKEDIEHTLIALMKRMLDHLSIGLQELIIQCPSLAEKNGTKNDSEFIVLKKNIFKLPHLFFDTEKDRISFLERTIFDLYHKYIASKNTHILSSIDFSE